jgi:mannose/cellobiose epimerase-like protein (N-acyl-D-glucosamine 2-epimerase family)
MNLQRDLLSADFWRRYLLDTFLQHWQGHCLDDQYGGYVADFDRQWRFTGPGHKSLVSQARLVYTFSAGFWHSQSAAVAEAAPSCRSCPSLLPGSPAFMDAAASGLQFLRQKMDDPQHGGWIWRVRRDGSVLEPVKHTYGHAFVVFGLSEHAKATGRKEPAQLALQTLHCLCDRAGGPGGGFWSIMDRSWQPIERRRGQNPHMHLLEACMSLHDATADPLAIETALQIADLAATRFVHPRYGCLEEYFEEDWSALSDDDAAPIQVGHQFEWCWLLNRLADRTGQEHWRDLGDQLMDWGLRYGTDRQHGGFFNSCSRRGDPLDTGKSHWVESEALRALLYLLIARKRDSLRQTLTDAADFIFTHFADPDYGGWYSSVEADGTPANTSKGSEWKLDYHMTSLCDEAIRLLIHHSAHQPQRGEGL